MINVNENLRQRGIDPMPDLRERPAFDSDDEPPPAVVKQFGVTPQPSEGSNWSIQCEPPCTRGYCTQRARYSTTVEVNGEKLTFYWCDRHANGRPNLVKL